MGIKYRVNEDFFNKWNSRMAYTLGFLYADGSLEDASYLRGKYVRLTSTDKDIVFKIKKWLDSEHNVVILKDSLPNRKQRYFLRIGSHKLYDRLTELGLYPNKSLTMSFPKISGRYLNDFIRGYFDGDGCVYLELSNGKKQKIIIKKLSTIFTSGSKKFLQTLKFILKKEIEVSQNNIYNSQRAFQLRYCTSDSIKLFKFLYKNTPKDLYFKRKFKVFVKYFKMRSSVIDKEIGNILNSRNKGHVVK